MKKPSVVIVSPALADANNGNWQTASRWAKLLASHYDVSISDRWSADSNHGTAQYMIALHARRSADAIANWAKSHNASCDVPGLVVALTGTDLYKDIQTDANAQQSLNLAQRLIVLQDQAPDTVPAAYRHKTDVVFQSCSARQTLPKTTRHLNVVMVGHLRAEKMPQTLFEAARLLKDDPHIHIRHIGDALDARLGELAQETEKANPRYQWLKGLPHDKTRRMIQQAHVLVHCSQLEGGAHVIMEAVRCGTVVLASRMDGNVGMLGDNYGGYFPVGDATTLSIQLKSLLQSLQGSEDPSVSHFYNTLGEQCASRATLFDAAHEKAALLSTLARCTPA